MSDLVCSSVQVQVRGQSVQSAFATHAGFFVAAERARRVKLVVRVRPDHAGFDLAGDLEDLRALVGPHAAAETVWRVVRLLDRFFDRAERLDRDDRAEDFFLHDAVRLRATEEKSRPTEEA